MKLTIAHYVFTPEELSQLRDYRNQQRDGRLKIRFLAFLLLAEEMPIETVARSIGKSVKTLENWDIQFFTNGLDCLNSFNYQGKRCSLNPSQLTQLVAWVKKTKPAKTKHVRAYILEQFRVAYTIEAVRQLLHKQGLKRLRPKKNNRESPPPVTLNNGSLWRTMHR